MEAMRRRCNVLEGTKARHGLQVLPPSPLLVVMLMLCRGISAYLIVSPVAKTRNEELGILAAAICCYVVSQTQRSR